MAWHDMNMEQGEYVHVIDRQDMGSGGFRLHIDVDIRYGCRRYRSDYPRERLLVFVDVDTYLHLDYRLT